MLTDITNELTKETTNSSTPSKVKSKGYIEIYVAGIYVGKLLISQQHKYDFETKKASSVVENKQFMEIAEKLSPDMLLKFLKDNQHNMTSKIEVYGVNDREDVQIDLSKYI